jgi:hypothetical protein
MGPADEVTSHLYSFGIQARAVTVMPGEQISVNSTLEKASPTNLQ